MTTQQASTIDQEQPQPLAGGNHHNGGQHPPVTFSPQDDANEDDNITPEAFARIAVDVARSLSIYRQARRSDGQEAQQ